MYKNVKNNTMNQKIIIILMLILLWAGNTFAQNDNYLIDDSVLHVSTTEKLVWDVSFSFKTMNVFRGLLPSRAPAFSTLGGIKAGSFVLGFYGGASTNGGYTETDLILMYYPLISIFGPIGITTLPKGSLTFLSPQVSLISTLKPPADC